MHLCACISFLCRNGDQRNAFILLLHNANVANRTCNALQWWVCSHDVVRTVCMLRSNFKRTICTCIFCSVWVKCDCGGSIGSFTEMVWPEAQNWSYHIWWLPVLQLHVHVHSHCTHGMHNQMRLKYCMICTQKRTFIHHSFIIPLNKNWFIHGA